MNCGLFDCLKVFLVSAVVGAGVGAVGYMTFSRRLPRALPPSGDRIRLPRGKGR